MYGIFEYLKRNNLFFNGYNYIQIISFGEK